MSATLEHVEQSEWNETELPPYPVKRWTVEEYHELVKAGMFDEVRVELLEGWICPKMTKSTLHEGTLSKVQKRLLGIIGDEVVLRVQQAFTTSHSEPEPDFAIVDIQPNGYFDRHPTGRDCKLIIEVADSSLAKDRRKAVIYAETGVPMYWIVNLQTFCVEVYERLNPETHQYLIQQTLNAGQELTLKLGDQSYKIPVEDLLPPQAITT